MQCAACGESIPDDSMFCPECGARQGGGATGVPGQAPAAQPNMGGAPMGGFPQQGAPQGYPQQGLPPQGMPQQGMMPAATARCHNRACLSKASLHKACPSRAFRHRACPSKACLHKVCHNKDSNPGLEVRVHRCVRSAGQTCRNRTPARPWRAAWAARVCHVRIRSLQVEPPSRTIRRRRLRMPW